jgi:hypothetical protein
MLQSELVERTVWISPSQTKRAAALLILTSEAPGVGAILETYDTVAGTGTAGSYNPATDVPRKRQALFVNSTRDLVDLPIQRQLAPYGTVTPGSSDLLVGQDTQGWPPVSNEPPWAPAARISPLVLNGQQTTTSADIVSGFDVWGWPPEPPPLWAPPMRFSQIILTLPAPLVGSGAIAEASDIVTGSGGQSITGSGTIAEAADQVVGVGTQAITGAGTVIEAVDVVAGVGTQSAIGSGTIAEAPDVVSGIGTAAITGAGAIAEPADIVAGQGQGGGFGTGAIVEPADAVSGQGFAGGTGAGAITEASDAVAGTGTLASTGAGAIAEPADVMTGTGTGAGMGSGAIQEGPDVATGSGTAVALGAGAIVEPSDQVVGTGAGILTGTAAITEQSDVVAGTGAGTGAIVEQSDTVAGVGIIQNRVRFGISTISVSQVKILEGSACFITINFVDSDGNPFLPSSAQYRLDDVASDTQILGWTSLPLTGTTVLLTITGAQNALVGRIFETHSCIVQFTDDYGNVDNIRTSWSICGVVGLPN